MLTDAERDAIEQERKRELLVCRDPEPFSDDDGPSQRPMAAKRPREDFLPPMPDLAEYFDEYGTVPAERLKICSAYGSYLRTIIPKKPKAAPRAMAPRVPLKK